MSVRRGRREEDREKERERERKGENRGKEVQVPFPGHRELLQGLEEPLINYDHYYHHLGQGH